MNDTMRLTSALLWRATAVAAFIFFYWCAIVALAALGRHAAQWGRPNTK